MKPKILGIQFRKKQESILQERECIKREVGEYVDIEFTNALDNDVTWDSPEVIMNEFNGVILGGSGDFDFNGGRAEDDPDRAISYQLLDKLHPTFTYIFDNDVPTFGICYGHQLLGAFAGVSVIYDEKQKKSRSHEVKLLIDKNDHCLFADLPDSFEAYYGHKDSLSQVPEGAVLLMNGGEACRVSALRYRKKIYTVQFHPELTFEDMVERIQNSPGYLPEGVSIEEVFSRDTNSNVILRNFGKWVAGY